ILRADARVGAGVRGSDHYLGPVRTPREPPMISGVITTRHVIRHAATIVREFGAAAYLRCCLVILRRQPVTFLECIFYKELRLPHCSRVPLPGDFAEPMQFGPD